MTEPDTDRGPFEVRLIREEGHVPEVYVESHQCESLDDAKRLGDSQLGLWEVAAIAPTEWWRKAKELEDKPEPLHLGMGEFSQPWPLEKVTPGRSGGRTEWEWRSAKTSMDVFPKVRSWPPEWNPLVGVFADEDEAWRVAAALSEDDLHLWAADCVARVVGVQEVALMSHTARLAVKEKRGRVSGATSKESLAELKETIASEVGHLEEQSSFDEENDDPEGDLWEGRWMTRIVPWASFKAAAIATQSAEMLVSLGRP